MRRQWMTGALLILLAATMSACGLIAAPSERMVPVFVQRTSEGFIIGNPCDIALPSARVEQPIGFAENPTFVWQADAVETPLPQVPFPTAEGYRVQTVGTLQADQDSLVIPAYSGSHGDSGIIVTFGELGVGDIAYQGGVVPESQWLWVRHNSFGC